MIIGLRHCPAGSLAPPLLQQNGVSRGLWVGCLWVRLGFFFLEICEDSVLSLVVHCWGGEFSDGVHVCGGFFWFVVFWPVRSSVVSTHSTGSFRVGPGQRVLAQGMRDRL